MEYTHCSMDKTKKDFTTQAHIPFDLCTATSIGDSEWLHIMLSLPMVRTEINSPNKSGWTPVMYSAYYGHDKILEMLIQKGAKVNLTNSVRQTALMLAVKCGNLTCCDILLKNGAAIDAVDYHSHTALTYAVCAGYDELTIFLMKNNASVNGKLGKYDKTPLMYASAFGHEKIVKILLDAGADPDLKTLRGQSARDMANEKGYYKVAELLGSYQTQVVSPVMGLKWQPKDFTDFDDVLPTTNSPHSLAVYEQPYPSDLASLLNSLGLGNYLPLFDRNAIQLPEFLKLTNENLKALGVDKLGPRSKMSKAISRLNSRFLHVTSDVDAIEYVSKSEVELVQRKISGSLKLNKDSNTVRVIKESMLPLLNLNSQSNALLERVRQIHELLWEEQSKLDPCLLSQFLNKLQDIERLGVDIHSQVSTFLQTANQLQTN